MGSQDSLSNSPLTSVVLSRSMGRDSWARSVSLRVGIPGIERVNMRRQNAEGFRSRCVRWFRAIGLTFNGILLVTASSHAGVINASWTAPTTNTGGSSLKDIALTPGEEERGRVMAPAPDQQQLIARLDLILALLVRIAERHDVSPERLTRAREWIDRGSEAWLRRRSRGWGRTGT